MHKWDTYKGLYTDIVPALDWDSDIADTREDFIGKSIAYQVW